MSAGTPGATVLIVDDDPGVRIALVEALRLAGYTTIAAPTGREGIVRARQVEVALAIVDLFMPDVNGIEVIRTLRRERPSLPILAISGAGGLLPGARDLLDIALFAGATRVLQKPVDVRTLVDVVRSLAPPPAGAPPT